MTGDLTFNQALSVWSELEAAYYGKNGYGGDTAEIYAFRIQPYRPSVEFPNTQIGAEAIAEQARIAGENLYWLICKFQNLHECRIQVNEQNPTILLGGFEYRCHVKVIHKEKRDR